MMNNHGFVLPKMVFMVMLVSVTILALMGLGLHTFAATSRADRRCVAEDLATDRLLLAQTQPADFAPSVREPIEETIDGVGYTGELVTRPHPSLEQVLEVRVAIRWSGQEIQRTRWVSLDS